MFVNCALGPTRKHVPIKAVTLPNVNMKMKLELQSPPPVTRVTFMYVEKYGRL